VHFAPLGRAAIRAIALRELEALKQRPGMHQRGLEVDIDQSVVDWLVVNGYEPRYGARFLKRALERNVTTELASAVVRAGPTTGARFELTVRGARVIARPAFPSAAAPPERARVELPVGTMRARETLDAAALAVASRRSGPSPPRCWRVSSRREPSAARCSSA